jgi:hypothetical protein
MNKSIPLLAAAIACLATWSVAGPAMARSGSMGGSIGSGGHMSETTSPGAMSPGSMGNGGRMSGTMSPPATQMPSAQGATPVTSSGMRNPNAGSNSSNVFRSLDSPIPGIANTPNP